MEPALIVVGLIGLMVYFAPWLVAVARRARRTPGIFVINLFLGWTLLGWVGALAWAVAADADPGPDQRGA